MEALVEIDFDSGTRYYSRTGIRAPHAFYEPLIASFGGISREISLVPGDYQSAQVSVTFSNASGEFSRLRDSDSWRNRPYRILLGNPDLGFLNFAIAFVGRLENWNLTKEVCTIGAVDFIQSRLKRPLNFVINSGFFHRLPDETARALVPLVIGEVSSPGGALPAYLVEPAVEIAVFRYVACQGRARSVDDVFAYGVLVDPMDYTISYGTGPQGTALTFIDFDSDPRIPGDTTEPHVSWNGSGITDDDTETGNPITNGARQLEKFLLLNGFSAAEIDADTVADAADSLSAKQIRGGFAAVERETTIGEVVRRFCESYNLQVFPTSEGKVGITAPTVVIDENAVLPEITALSDVVRDTFQVAGPDAVGSTLVAGYGQNFFTGVFLGQLEQTNPQQVSALGENVPVAVECPYIRDNVSMVAVANIKMFFLQEQRQVSRIAVPPRWHELLEIGREVRLTHFAGPGTAGYVRRIFRIVGMGAAEVGSGNVAASLALVDLTAEPFFFVPLADFCALPFVSSDYFGLGRVARGRLRLVAAPVEES